MHYDVSMQIHRPRLDTIGARPEYGDTVELYLTADDLDHPPDEGIYNTWRFMEVAADGLTLPGWAPDDKIHLLHRLPAAPTDQDKTLQLGLDNGGDWYLEIWRTQAFSDLRSGVEFSTLPNAPYPFLTRDPSNLIALNGIHAVRFYAQEYEESRRTLPF